MSEEILRLRAQSVDPAEVAAIAAEHGVNTTAPSPGIALYLADLTQAVAETLIGWLSIVFGGDVEFWGTFLLWTAYALLSVTAGVVLFLLGRYLWDRYQERRPPISPTTVRESLLAPTAPVDHEADLERALDAGQVAEALVSLWWWLASTLLKTPADPSWTGRELLRRADRRDLLPWVRRFDRMLYGPVAPDIKALRSFWGELRAAVVSIPTTDPVSTAEPAAEGVSG